MNTLDAQWWIFVPGGVPNFTITGFVTVTE